MLTSHFRQPETTSDTSLLPRCAPDQTGDSHCPLRLGSSPATSAPPGITRAASKRARTTITERYPERRPRLFTYPATTPPRAVQLQRNTQLTVFNFTRSLQFANPDKRSAASSADRPPPGNPAGCFPRRQRGRPTRRCERGAVREPAGAWPGPRPGTLPRLRGACRAASPARGGGRVRRRGRLSAAGPRPRGAGAAVRRRPG
jgi:hypothetical protein